MASAEELKKIRTDIDWSALSFSYLPTRSHIRAFCRNGTWSTGELLSDPNITMSIAATCLHYGQAVFEGLKAFRCRDGKVRVFRPDESAKRLNLSAARILGPAVDRDFFLDLVRRVVLDNIDYVPPYETGGSLYIRPLYIGVGPQVGVAPSLDYELLIMVMPVGPYYKSGLKGVRAMVIEDFDRAAPLGTGAIKLGGNYGASLLPAKIAHDRGFLIPLFMDPKTHEYVDEFGTSNFFGITKDGVYVTPASSSILASITNKSLQQVAADMGIKVERRKIHRDELADFAEVGACGTAVVITPVSEIVAADRTYRYGDSCGPVMKKLYDAVTGIQYGTRPDTHSWTFEV